MKFRALILLSIAAAVVTAQTSSAAVKAGDLCKVAGKKTTANGKVFTCVKSGKKLVWNKGVAVVKPAPKPAETVAPVPEKSAEPTPVATPTPSPSPVATGPSAAITFDNLEIDWVNLEARKKILAYYETTSPLSSAYEVIAGPNVVLAQIDEEKRLLDIAARMFSKYFKPDKYQVVFFSEKDGAWGDQALATYGGGFPTTIAKEIERWPNGCNFAFATVGKNMTPIYYQCMYTGGRQINDKQTAIHEYFHLVQNKYATKGGIPCWAHEGSAQYFGMALGVDGSDPSGKATLQFTRNLTYAFNPGGDSNLPPNRNLIDRVQTLGGFLEVMKLEEGFNTNCQPLASYAVGSIMTEVMIAVKGFETYMDWLMAFNQSTDWKSSFQRIYGLSVDEFYAKSWPYFKGRLEAAYKSEGS